MVLKNLNVLMYHEKQRAMTENERELGARILKAVAHPLRLGILELLAGRREMTATELFDRLACSQSMMSQQLDRLDRQHLIETRKEGNHKFYSLRNRNLMKLFSCLKDHMHRYLDTDTSNSPAASSCRQKKGARL